MMRDTRVYRALGKLRTSDYYGLPPGQIQELIGLNDAHRYLTFLALQNDFNRSLLYLVSDKGS